MKMFILRDKDEFQDLHGHNEDVYILRFNFDQTAYDLQDHIDYFMGLYADYDEYCENGVENLDEDRVNDISDDLKDLEACGCQFEYTINKLKEIYKDMSIEQVCANSIELWY